uniref:Uncharacterized protein n=1 Tax=viral metagenome TaxID=1070528 RepID=A0A6C0C310_9ZZZZ
MFTSYTKNNKITDDRKLKNLSLLDLTKIATPENPLGSYVNMGEPNFEMLIQKDIENLENMAFYATEKPKNNENEEDAQEVALETKEENVLKQYLADHTSGQIYLGALSVVGLYVVFKMMKLGK